MQGRLTRVCVCVCVRTRAPVCRATSPVYVCVQGHLTHGCVCVCVCVQDCLTWVCVCVQGRLTRVYVCVQGRLTRVCVCVQGRLTCACVCVFTPAVFSPEISPHPGVPSYPGQGVGAVSPHLKGGPSLLTGVSPHPGWERSLLPRGPSPP